MDQAKAFDELKRRQLDAWLERPPSGAPVELWVEVAGQRGKFVLTGDAADRNAAFLRAYYARFLAEQAREAAFTVRYETAPGAHGDCLHPLWDHDAVADFRIVPRAGALSVVQRDFVGLLDLGTSTMRAFGPALSERTPDSIDNAFLLVANKALADRGIVCLHAATVEHGGWAYVFYGDSGVGKSTLAALSHAKEGLRVLSGDQIYLRSDGEGALIACASPITIAQLPREAYAWCTSELPVRALIHLVRRPDLEMRYRALGPAEALSKLLRQVMSRDDFNFAEAALDVALDLVQRPGLALGELSYPKDQSFWNALLRSLDEQATQVPGQRPGESPQAL